MSEPASPELIPHSETATIKQHGRGDRKVHPSAVDWWLAVLLVFPIAMSLAVGIGLVAVDRAGDAAIMFLTAVGILLVTAIFTVPCRYTLLADTLSIRCGVICYQVPYSTIRDIELSSTLKSGPALSLRRIVIRTDRREHIISPVNRERFIEQLKARMSA